MGAGQDWFVFDADSTVVDCETLELLSARVLAGQPDGESLCARIEDITNRAMAGEISISAALDERVRLIPATREDIQATAEVIKGKVTPSFAAHADFIRENRERCFVISNGFEDLLLPCLAELGFDEERVFANRFTFDSSGRVSGVDRASLLQRDGGKSAQLAELGLRGRVHLLGDGMTDFRMKSGHEEAVFYAFTENVERSNVVAVADHVVNSLDEFLEVHEESIVVSQVERPLRVLMLENIHPLAVKNLEEAGFEVECVAGSLSEDALCDALRGISILGVRSKTQVTARVLDAAESLLAVGCFCIGTDQVDLGHAASRGVATFNAPYSNTRSVVELTIGSIVMLLRRTFVMSQEVHGGLWNKSATGCREIRGKRLGIVGYGNIGSQLSVLAESLGLQVYFYDVEDRLALGNARKCASLEELLAETEILSLHVDGREGNRGLIGARELGLLRAGAVVMNMSRGKVLDLDALADALEGGEIAGAAVDVYPEEPRGRGASFESRLQGIPNVILTPHIGGSTQEAQLAIGDFVSVKLRNFINSGDTVGSVNMPELRLLGAEGACRLLHMHANTPGILAEINSILAEGELNIVGQSLKTSPEIGYVVTDVDAVYRVDVVERLAAIGGTIKVRIP